MNESENDDVSMQDQLVTIRIEVTLPKDWGGKRLTGVDAVCPSVFTEVGPAEASGVFLRLANARVTQMAALLDQEFKKTAAGQLAAAQALADALEVFRHGR